MPLALVGIGEKCMMKGFSCSHDVCMRMVNMGFIPGCPIEVINRLNGTLLVKVGESRLMLDCCLAHQIEVI